MSRKIYIDYENWTYYVTEEELRVIFVEEGEAPNFEDWLENNYTAVEIYKMTERERDEIIDEFDKYFTECFDEWVDGRFTVIEVDVLFSREN